MHPAACGRCREQMVELATGPVSRVLPEKLQAHLVVCPGCRAEWEELQQVVAWLRELPEPAVPAGFWEELDRRLQEAALPARPHVSWRGLVRVAALAALVGLAALHRTPPGAAPVVSPAVQALLPQVADLVRAWDAATGEGEPW